MLGNVPKTYPKMREIRNCVFKKFSRVFTKFHILRNVDLFKGLAPDLRLENNFLKKERTVC